METIWVRDPADEDIEIAAEIIRSGGLVAFPTETVYGLGANALRPDAARKVYAAKGRPSDNPLIIHLAQAEDAERYCFTNSIFYDLAKRFLPGPLTIVLPRRPVIPSQVTGGLSTVAVRIPSHPIANRLIRAAGVPIAAPSANLSGRPSCTRAAHVYEDMNGRIDMILDGGESEIGVESTIVSIDGGTLTMLRPGGVTAEMLREAGYELKLDKAVTSRLADTESPLAPGMKYRHYAPRASVVLLSGTEDEIHDFLRARIREPGTAVIGYDEFCDISSDPSFYRIGREDGFEEQAHNVFDILRRIDGRDDIQRVYAAMPPRRGVGLAVFNRLLKASGYTVLDLHRNTDKGDC